ncbi:uncharacterized protein LOC107803119 isoform X5 [Nicotiana tabacum]|uniref:Uncharacterized protein isoform X5 n=2 Tax=Nicotiana tabacum TaxID=4097 RepID=A0A1S4AZW9_TOBAC|nr:PREDICTED: uncharacterized protein LOC107803119 isoform X5 [Nicotiana tabacum]XP_016482232.1 PREDICTED: uncharacterized protein LOC107803119 isoform X5 [Nicotiana tabacum]XP_016482233.1 PREDICTED: uncharacterized protein LOC107803119 isoform X5 [Nicotiana tabacum]XP_016482234.1 PREDICTED: uncharacterized protein LOC107803119 isoform X5 [Nicotiana tabacum]
MFRLDLPVAGMHFLFGPLRIEHLTVNTTGKQVYLQCQLPPCTTNQLQDLQDHISRMLIGAGERKDGLCYFRNKQRVCALKEHPNRMEKCKESIAIS